MLQEVFRNIPWMLLKCNVNCDCANTTYAVLDYFSWKNCSFFQTVKNTTTEYEKSAWIQKATSVSAYVLLRNQGLEGVTPQKEDLNPCIGGDLLKNKDIYCHLSAMKKNKSKWIIIKETLGIVTKCFKTVKSNVITDFRLLFF